MKFLLLISFISSLYIQTQHCVDKKPSKIAIIGAGIGGTSCALFLKDLLHEKAEIFIYEHKAIGGRLAPIEHNDGSVYITERSISKNDVYASKLVERFNLKKIRPTTSHVYSKKKLLSMGQRKLTISQLPATSNFHQFLKQSNECFKNIYENLEHKYTQETPGKLLASIFMLNYVDRNIEQCLQDFKMGEDLLKLCQCRLMTDCGQYLEVQSFAGFLSLNKLDNSVYTIEGGSVRLAEKCLKESNAHLYFKEIVLEIRGNDLKKFTITSMHIENKISVTHVRKFDHVILATPFAENLKGIRIIHNNQILQKIKGFFIKTVVTILDGKLRTEYFNSKRAENVKFITFLDNGNILSIFRLKRSSSRNDFDVWKIQSLEQLTNKEIEELFEVKNKPKIVTKIVSYPNYRAYNNLSKNEELTFVLRQNLFHINSIEWLASSIEMSIIGAKNIALMIFKDMTKSWAQILEETYIPSK